MKDAGLRDKVVIITGGSSGIGRATAVRFAEEGSRVAIWDAVDKDSKTLLKEIREAGGKGSFQLVDVVDVGTIESAVTDTVGRWGQIDVLINNAGIVRDAQLAKFNDGQMKKAMTDEQWDAVIAVNLKGVFACTRAVVPHMIKQGGGVILSASSIIGLYGNFGQTNYVAAKAGVIGMTKTWARELGKYNIRVNAVAPGFVGTEMVLAVPPKIVEKMVAHTPLGKLGKPEDIANAYVWLSSNQASFVHGAVISVDGGLVIGT